MTALKSAVMVNIQSHTHTIMEFPQVGIIRFHGNNSNGKSVLVKVLSDVVSNAITRPANRRSIIRRGHSYGELSMSRYDGAVLFIRIDLEAAHTYAELSIPGRATVRRYLADKSIPLLVREFGWHYSGDHGISLNIHQDVDSFLFVDTKKSLNFDLLNSVRSDQYAEASAESLSQLLKASKRQRQEVIHAYEVAQATYVALEFWDVEKEQQIKDECLLLAQLIECLDIPPPPLAPYVPDIQVFDLPPRPPLYNIPDLLPVFTEKPPEVSSLLQELSALQSGVCPTCNRKFVEDVCHEIS